MMFPTPKTPHLPDPGILVQPKLTLTHNTKTKCGQLFISKNVFYKSAVRAFLHYKVSLRTMLPLAERELSQ